MPDTTLRRVAWTGDPMQVGIGFRMTKRKGSRTLTATCTLFSHELGHELRLDVCGLMSRTKVCRSSDEIVDTCEQWRSTMLAAGWAESR